MTLAVEVGHDTSETVLHGDPAPRPQKGTEPSIFGPCLLGPNCCMDQDTTWYGGRPRPSPHYAKKWAQPPIFGPCLLWPNGWMDQDATW